MPLNSTQLGAKMEHLWEDCWRVTLPDGSARSWCALPDQTAGFGRPEVAAIRYFRLFARREGVGMKLDS